MAPTPGCSLRVVIYDTREQGAPNGATLVNENHGNLAFLSGHTVSTPALDELPRAKRRSCAYLSSSPSSSPDSLKTTIFGLPLALPSPSLKESCASTIKGSVRW